MRTSQCQGFARTKGRRCHKVAQRNGFCHVHDPERAHCRGIAKGGVRCDVTGLDKDGFCRFHQDQHQQPPYPPNQQPQTGGFIPFGPNRCQGIASSTGHRCKKDFEVYPNGFCIYHQDQWRGKIQRGLLYLPQPGAAWRPMGRR